MMVKGPAQVADTGSNMKVPAKLQVTSSKRGFEVTGSSERASSQQVLNT